EDETSIINDLYTGSQDESLNKSNNDISSNQDDLKPLNKDNTI
ncbi:3587_t:CDS:2, partial [Racocetra persica]